MSGAGSIIPIHEAPREKVEGYLTDRGIDPDIVRWKYFDDDFNRVRGLVWVRDDQAEGFIGAVPGTIRRGDESQEFLWMCDWSLREPGASPGMGALMLKWLTREYGPVLALGGNEITRKIAPRMARRTITDAASVYHLVLRTGAYVEKVASRIPALRLDRWPVINSVPVPRGRRAPNLECGLMDGVPRVLTDLQGLNPRDQWAIVNDWRYVDWAVRRCPHLVTETMLAPEHDPCAAVVCWRRKSSEKRWRIALFAAPGCVDALRSALAASVNRIYRQGAHVISAVVGGQDAETIEALKWAGFSESAARLPFFVFAETPEHARIDSARGLSYLDTDLAYRF